jgi:hypothetical protein
VAEAGGGKPIVDVDSEESVESWEEVFGKERRRRACRRDHCCPAKGGRDGGLACSASRGREPALGKAAAWRPVDAP